MPCRVPPQQCYHVLQLLSKCSALESMCTALHAGSHMLTSPILTVPRGGQCTCSHLPSTQKINAHYDYTPPRALHMALLTPRELQIPP